MWQCTNNKRYWRIPTFFALFLPRVVRSHVFWACLLNHLVADITIYGKIYCITYFSSFLLLYLIRKVSVLSLYGVVHGSLCIVSWFMLSWLDKVNKVQQNPLHQIITDLWYETYSLLCVLCTWLSNLSLSQKVCMWVIGYALLSGVLLVYLLLAYVTKQHTKSTHCWFVKWNEPCIE